MGWQWCGGNRRAIGELPQGQHAPAFGYFTPSLGTEACLGLNSAPIAAATERKYRPGPALLRAAANGQGLAAA